jgi:DNA topoisomerase-1
MKYFSWDIIKGLLPYFGMMIVIIAVYEVVVLLKNKAKTKINEKIASIKTNGGVCPKCGGKLIMREGKYGNFIGCSNFPKCRYTQK